VWGRGAGVPPAGDPAVVVPVRQAVPARGPLAGDVRLGSLPLGVQGVEFLLQPLLGGLAGVDGTPDDRRRGMGSLAVAGHRFAPFPTRPKKAKPLQWLPVAALATALRRGSVEPSYWNPPPKTRT